MGKKTGVSGFDRACTRYKEILKVNKSPSRQELIAEFIKLGISPGASSTYASTVKSKVGGSTSKVVESTPKSKKKAAYVEVIVPTVAKGGRKYVLGAPVRFSHKEVFTPGVAPVELKGKIVRVNDDSGMYFVKPENYTRWTGTVPMGPFTKEELKLL